MRKSLLLFLLPLFLLSFFFLPIPSLAATPSTSSGQVPTLAELQTQIQLLLKQIQAVQAQKAGNTASSATSFGTFTLDMQFGSSGSQVATLQQFLVSKKYMVMPPGVAFGYYGPLTRGSVIKFQTGNGVSGTGIVGPLTRARLNALGGPSGVPSGSLIPSASLGSSSGGGRSRAISIPSTTNPSYPAPRVTLVSSAYNISLGQSVTLSWTTGDTSSCGASQGWSG
ncbi:MAG: peptidoglycan-binding domain-containing protein, partial [Patescibacteria group bacterium]